MLLHHYRWMIRDTHVSKTCLSKKSPHYVNWYTILFRTFWNFSKFKYRFQPTQIKRRVISSIRQFICELCHKRLKTLDLWK